MRFFTSLRPHPFDLRVCSLITGILILAACTDRGPTVPDDLNDADAIQAAKGGGMGGGKGGGKPGGEEPPPPDPDPAIAFVQNTALMVMNADGSNKSAVLDAGERYYEPNWSPDGLQLVFGSDIQGAGVYVIDVDGTNLRKVVATITAGSSTNPVWSPLPSPDGSSKIVYVDLPGQPDETLESGNHDLFAVNLDGNEAINLTNTRELSERSPTWSPSAMRLAADVARFTPAEPGVELGIVVYQLGVTDGQLAIIAETNITAGGPLSGAYAFLRPSWAKTQDKIAVPVFETGSSLRDFWVIDLADPANPVNITQTPDVSENMPSWSPDDSQITFQGAGAKKRISIFTMNADGTGVTEIGKPPRSTRQASPDWRRNP